MRTAVDRGVVLLVEGSLGVEHLHRLLRGRAAVEVHQPPAVAYGAAQDREVRAHPLDIDAAGTVHRQRAVHGRGHGRVASAATFANRS